MTKKELLKLLEPVGDDVNIVLSTSRHSKLEKLHTVDVHVYDDGVTVVWLMGELAEDLNEKTFDTTSECP